jgi:hypothetical protein
MIGVLAVAVAALVYVLSVGPAAACVERRWLSEQEWELFYTPILRATEGMAGFDYCLRRYVHAWAPSGQISGLLSERYLIRHSDVR